MAIDSSDSSWAYMTPQERERYNSEVALRARNPTRPPASWNDLLGGSFLVSGEGEVRSTEKKGVFAQHPGCTPKYDTSVEGAPASMARLLVPFPSGTQRDAFMESLYYKGADVRKLGEMLAVDEQTSTGYTAVRGEGLGYVDFLLQTAQESHQEKVQVVDVLSDNYVAYFFGQSPPIFTYQGTLLNTYQDDWRSAFSIIYNEIIRGTKLARRRRLLTLTYDNVAVTGTAIAMSQTLTADMEMAADFTLEILVKRYDIYRLANTTPTAPGGFPSKVVDVNTFGGLHLGRVKRTFRTIGAPQVATSEPKKAQDEETTPTTDYGKAVFEGATEPGTGGGGGTYGGPATRVATVVQDQMKKDVRDFVPESEKNPVVTEPMIEGA